MRKNGGAARHCFKPHGGCSNTPFPVGCGLITSYGIKVGSLKKVPFRQGPFFWTSCPSSPKSVAPALWSTKFNFCHGSKKKQWRSKGGGGHSGPCPLKANHRRPTSLLPPKPGPLDPLGPLTEVDFLSGLRVMRDGSGPRGKHQGSE